MIPTVTALLYINFNTLFKRNRMGGDGRSVLFINSVIQFRNIIIINKWRPTA